MKYIGKGNYLIGIPARDLTREEVSHFGKARLLASGLYIEPKAAKVKPPKEEVIDKENIE